MNLVSASPVHQRIISIGNEPLVEDNNDSLGSVPDDDHRAFTFEIEQKKKDKTDIYDDDNFDTVTISAQMSSVVETVRAVLALTFGCGECALR